MMLKGDLVLINFPFTDLSGSKLRPEVILMQTNFDLTVCFITTQIQWREQTDVIKSQFNEWTERHIILSSK